MHEKHMNEAHEKHMNALNDTTHIIELRHAHACSVLAHCSCVFAVRYNVLQFVARCSL